MGVILGFVVGYVMGARAGERGFEDLKNTVASLGSSEALRDLVSGGTSLLTEALKSGGKVLSQASGPQLRGVA